MAMRERWSPFEIMTGAGAAYLALAFACVSLEAARIETGVAARAVAALDDAGLYWFAVEPDGRRLVVTGAAAEPAAARAVVERLDAVSGVSSIQQRIEVVGAAGDCQQALDAVQAERPVTFRKGLAEPSPASEPVLAAAAAAARACGIRIEVAVHAGGDGSAALGLALSQRRADLVARRLAAHGVAADRIVATGYGASQPVARSVGANDPAAGDVSPEAVPDGRAIGQRVEFRVLGAAT